MNTFIVSDLHIDHFTDEKRNILVYDGRPFKTMDEMRKDIVTKTNERATKDDRLIINGDGMMGCNKFEKLIKFLDELTCENIYWVRGNHDGERFANKNGEMVEKGWSYDKKDFLIGEGYLKCIEDFLHVKWTQPHLFVCHYALRTWPDQGRGTFLCFGHSHNNLPDDPHTLSIDVCCNGNNNYPYSMDDIRAWMNMKTPKQVDHH